MSEVIYYDDIGAPMFAIEVDECEHVLGYIDGDRNVITCDVCLGVISTLDEVYLGSEVVA